jgi:cytochrome c oxidase cbb3-type subunit II
MSDQLSAAATAMGLPEALVERSAKARAADTGASYEDILAQWAGGEAAPTPAPPVEEAAAEEPADEPEAAAPAEEPAAAPEVVIEVPEPARAPEPVPTGPYKPPVLVGTKDNPLVVLAGIVGLFLVVVLVGLIGPSIPVDTVGARTSEIPYDEVAEEGRQVYLQSGCAFCHTQMVRPVVADVGLGAATLNDTNQVLGTVRFGPDLSNIGARITAAQIEAIIAGLGDHPAHSLGSEDMAALVAYLSQSQTLIEETTG